MAVDEKDTRLIWIDLEMTGLNVDSDDIIEIATIVTDQELNILAEGPELAIHVDESVLKGMDEWCVSHHSSSGLWKRVLESQHNMRQAEEETLAFLRQWVNKGASPMCGNSICQDRRFMARQMPELEAFFHYRNLDVSTLKELARRWAPTIHSGLKKAARHLAMDDIRDSIEELRYYRKYLGELGGMI